MLDIFITTFWATFLAVLKVFLIIFAAGILVRKNVINQDQVKALTGVTIKLFLPCLIFSSIITTFEPGAMKLWWVLPLMGAAMVFFGLAMGGLIFWRDMPAKKNMLPLAGMQNAGYLILPVGAVLYADQFEKFALYCFLYILSMSPLLWTVGKYLVTAGADEKLSWKHLITPPFVAIILALILVFTRIGGFIPSVAVDSISLLGQATVPVATFILGAVLGGIPFKWRPYIADGARTMAVKFLLVPLATIAVLQFTSLRDSDPLMAGFLVLQAAAAPATALILQVRHWGGDEQKISSIMLMSYIVCIFMMPFWLAVWQCLG